MYFRTRWLDPRLSHNNSDIIILEGDAIANVWQPDVFFVNKKQESDHRPTNRPDVLLWIYSNGTVFSSKR